MNIIDINLSKVFELKAESNVQRVRGCYNWNPQIWIELLNSSPHYTILSKKVDIAMGKRLIYEDNGNQEAKEFFDSQIRPNAKKILWDQGVFNGFISLNTLSKSKKKIVKVQHQPMQSFRVRKFDIDIKECEIRPEYNWYIKNYTKVTPYPLYERITADIKDDVFVGYKRSYSVIDPIYPVPDYFGAVDYLKIDINIGKFNLNATKNAFISPGVFEVPNMPQQYTSESENTDNPIDNPLYLQFVKSFKDLFTGPENAGKLIFITADAGVSFKFTPIKADPNVDYLNNIGSNAILRIIAADGITSPSLVALGGSGNLNAGGNGGELAIAYEIFINEQIKPKMQNPFLEYVKEILEFNGYPTGCYFEQSQPIQFIFGSDILAKILTVNEGREKVGLSPIVDGELIIDPSARTRETTTPTL